MTLTVKDLTYRYAKTTAPVLQGISFTAESGDFLSVLGANGAGKSTLFRCLLGGLTDYTGTIELDGRDVRTLSRRETAEHIAPKGATACGGAVGVSRLRGNNSRHSCFEPFPLPSP